MPWRTKIRCFFAFKVPLSFYRRNYDGWEEISVDSLADWSRHEGCLLLSSLPEEEKDISDGDKQSKFLSESKSRNSLEKMDLPLVKEENQVEHDILKSLTKHSAVMLREKPFLKRTGLVLLRLFFQSFGLSFAISFSLSMPALLQLIPLELKLSLIALMSPLSFVFDPLVQFYSILMEISRYIQGYDPTWIYVLAEQWFRALMNTIPFLPNLPERKISWQWQTPPGDMDRPQVAPQHQLILGKLHQLIPNQWLNLFLLWLLIAVPLFFFLSYRLSRQVIELMPEKGYLNRVRKLRKTMEDCKGITIVGVKKNRLVDETSGQWKFFKMLRFLSRYGMIFSFVFPILLGILFAFI